MNNFISIKKRKIHTYSIKSVLLKHDVREQFHLKYAFLKLFKRVLLFEFLIVNIKYVKSFRFQLVQIEYYKIYAGYFLEKNVMLSFNNFKIVT